MSLRLQIVKMLAAATLVVLSVSYMPPTAQAQARNKVPYEYETDGTNWVTLFDGKSLTGWMPLELGGSGPVEFVSDFTVPGQTNSTPTPVIQINRGDMLSGIAWTNGPIRMDYEIEWEGMRLNGNDFFCAMSFPVKDSYVTFIPSGWGGSVVGISSVDGHDASENETSKFLKLEDKTWHKFKIRVTTDLLEAWVNDKQVVKLKTTGKELSLRSGSPAEIKKYGIVCTTYATSGALKNLRMRKIK